LSTIAGATGTQTTIPYPGTTDRISVPSDSVVRFSGFKNDAGDQFAGFQGRLLLTGTYYYGDAEFNDGNSFDAEASIRPDPAVLARLPHFVIRRGESRIYLRNPDDFAKAVIPKPTLTRANRKTGAYITGRVAVWVDDFAASIVCDGANYTVRFLSIERTSSLSLTSNPPNAAC
jgi:hypothetical protein